MPFYLDGLMIHIPSGSFYVAEACAGARFLICAVALGFLVANLNYRDFSQRLLVIGLSIVVPIVVNGFRAFGIVMTALLTDSVIFKGPITHTSTKAPKSPAHLTDPPIGRHGHEPVGVEEV